MLDEPHYPTPDPNRKSPKELWNERYEGESYLYGKQPSTFLKDHVGLLKKGKALDVAMGEGRNAVFLAQEGFKVTGVDVSPKGVEKANQLAAEKGVTIEAKEQNLDFFLVPLMGFDTIVMTYFKPLPRFFSEILRGLTVGGTLLLEGYTVDHFKLQSPPNPLIAFEDCFKANEVLNSLRSFRVKFYKEIKEGNQFLVQAVAEKFHS